MKRNNSIIDWTLRISFLLGIIGIASITHFETIFSGFLLLSIAFLLFLLPFVYYLLKHYFKRIIGFQRTTEKVVREPPLIRDSLNEKENIGVIEFVIKLAPPIILGLYFLMSEAYLLFHTDFSEISINESIPVILLGLRIAMIAIWPLIYAKDLINALFNGDLSDIRNLDIFQADLFHKTINLIITVLIIIRAIEIIFKF